jgi:hypothetical protein
MAYDHYAAVKTLADRLSAEGQSAWAGKLRDVMAAGATGTEIFMGLRWQLRELKRSGNRLSGETTGQVDTLLKELNSALR